VCTHTVLFIVHLHVSRAAAGPIIRSGDPEIRESQMRSPEQGRGPTRFFETGGCMGNTHIYGNPRVGVRVIPVSAKIPWVEVWVLAESVGPTTSCRTALYRRAADDDQELSLRNPDETQNDAAILLGPSRPIGNPVSTVSETVFTPKCLCRFGPPEETEEIGINYHTCDNELIRDSV